MYGDGLRLLLFKSGNAQLPFPFLLPFEAVQRGNSDFAINLVDLFEFEFMGTRAGCTLALILCCDH